MRVGFAGQDQLDVAHDDVPPVGAHLLEGLIEPLLFLRTAVVESDLLGVFAQLHAAVAEIGLDGLAAVE